MTTDLPSADTSMAYGPSPTGMMDDGTDWANAAAGSRIAASAPAASRLSTESNGLRHVGATAQICIENPQVRNTAVFAPSLWRTGITAVTIAYAAESAARFVPASLRQASSPAIHLLRRPPITVLRGPGFFAEAGLLLCVQMQFREALGRKGVIGRFGIDFLLTPFNSRNRAASGEDGAPRRERRRRRRA